MNTAVNNFSAQTAARPAKTNLLMSIASTLLCLNLREALAAQASTEQNDSANTAWGM